MPNGGTGIGGPSGSTDPVTAADPGEEDISAQLDAQSGNLFSDLANGNVPLGSFGTTGAWGLLNLLMALAALLVATVLFLRSLLRRREENAEEDDTLDDYSEETTETEPRWTLPRILAIVCGLLPGFVFLLLENLTQPMVWVNTNTLYVAIVTILFALLVGIQVLHASKTRQEPITADEAE